MFLNFNILGLIKTNSTSDITSYHVAFVQTFVI